MDDIIHYLTPGDLYQAGYEATGQELVARETRLVQVAAARPTLRAFGQEAYPTLLDKAAALMHAIAAHHIFWDGNKRAATRATVMFLERNGLRPTWSAQEAYDFVLEIAQGRHDVPEIAAWLAQHSAAV